MEKQITLWQRFKSKVPAELIKIQLILGVASTSFGSLAAINFTGKLSIIGEIAGYIAAACGGMIFIIQFAMKTDNILTNPTQNKVESTTPETDKSNSPE